MMIILPVYGGHPDRSEGTCCSPVNTLSSRPAASAPNTLSSRSERGNLLFTSHHFVIPPSGFRPQHVVIPTGAKRSGGTCYSPAVERNPLPFSRGPNLFKEIVIPSEAEGSAVSRSGGYAVSPGRANERTELRSGDRVACPTR